jgi:D-tyrosyl-tRNA(Tyr) deacylase
MRAVIQRVLQAEVQAGGETVGSITQGLLVLLAVRHDDTLADVRYLAAKLVNLRIFEDVQGKMNRDIRDHQGAILAVSQFTLYADCRKGRRPSFTQSAPPGLARDLYDAFVTEIAQLGVPVAQGCFGAHMTVSLVNDGPVTLILESPEKTAML